METKTRKRARVGTPRLTVNAMLEPLRGAFHLTASATGHGVHVLGRLITLSLALAAVVLVQSREAFASIDVAAGYPNSFGIVIGARVSACSNVTPDGVT